MSAPLTIKIKTRLYCPYVPALDKGITFLLNPSQAHYIRSVMRCQIHDYIGIFNGLDGEYACQIMQLDKKNVTVQCVQKIRSHLPPTPITLIFALIKKTPLSYLVQKATELGVGVMQPIITQRTTMRDINTERLQAISIEAAEQCGLTAIPDILPPKKLPEIYFDYQHILFCDERGTGKPIKQAIMEQKNPTDAFIIGPEGGFTASEAEFLYAQNNIQPISLGDRIMRAETAAIASLAIIQALQ